GRDRPPRRRRRVARAHGRGGATACPRRVRVRRLGGEARARGARRSLGHRSARPVASDHMKGRLIVVTAWVTFGLFFVTMVPDAFGVSAFDDLSAGVALGLFLAAVPVWLYAFGLAVVRSARGDDVGVGSLFFLNRSAPADVRRWMIGALVASIVL